MDDQITVYRGQVVGADGVNGEILVALSLGGSITVPLPRPLPLGGAGWGIHWLPVVGDWVLIQFEDGMQPVCTGPFLPPAPHNGPTPPAATLTPPLSPGEIRLVGATGATITLPASGGVVIGGVSDSVGLFGASPVPQQTGGTATAGGTYTATEQGMVNRMYAALRAVGVLS